MTPQIHEMIRQQMTRCGVWECAVNMKVYTTQEFVAAFGSRMPPELVTLLQDNVCRLQRYLDERILEPLQQSR